MLRQVLFGIFVFSMSLGLLSISSRVINETDFDKEWAAVDSLENNGLYRKALQRVLNVYELARRDKAEAVELKALIYKLRYLHLLNEDGFEDVLQELERERLDDRILFRAVKTSMLAEMYTMYYQNNRWSIFNNANLQSTDKEHPDSWSPSFFGGYIDQLYLESLENPGVLLSADISDYKKILRDTSLQTAGLNMFDLLSRRALDFYEMDEFDYSPEPLPGLLIDSLLFLPAQDFIKGLEGGDHGSSFFIRSLRLYSELLKYHLDIGEVPTFLYYDLQRLSYANSISLVDNAGKLYLESLDRLTKEIVIDSLRAQVFFEKASFYNQRSGNFIINGKDTAIYSNDKSQALRWARESANLGKDSRAGMQAENLIKSIKEPSLKIVSGNMQVPNRHLPLSLEYSNLKGLWYWITPVSPAAVINRTDGNQKLKGNIFAEGNSPVANGKFNLPDHGDYNPHRTTVDLPPLLEGNYQLLISGSPDPENEEDFISLGYLTVTDIAWFSKRLDDGSLVVYFVDRGSGNPVPGVRARQYFLQYDNRSRESKLVKGRGYFSDNNGQIIISQVNSHRSEPFNLLIGSDEFGVFTPDRFSIYNALEGERERIIQRIYTDRGIYRPGQEVMFAGLLANELKGGLEPWESQSLEVYIQDSRYKTLVTLFFETDRFGYFRGSFIIPSDAMGGSFRILTKWGQGSFQVEQYKRPGFRIEIERDTRLYRAGDTLYIGVWAEAFAGVDLKGAEVDIEAYLNLNGSNPFKYHFNNRRIRIGQTTGFLDAEGRFKWALKSISMPGSHFSKAGYEFLVKVKDKNGETREKSYNLSIGTSAVEARIAGPGKVDRRIGASWKISALSPGLRELNTKLLVSVGILNRHNIQELISPLPKPDTWVLGKREWEKKFPRVPWRDDHYEDSVARWIYSQEFDTGPDGIMLNPDISGWGAGRYRISVSLPESAEQVVGQFDFDVYDSRLKAFPARDPLWLNVTGDEYEPGQIIEYHLGSRYPGLYLIEITGNDTVYLNEWVSLSNRLKKKRIPVTDDMRGNIFIQLSGVYENNHFTQKHVIEVPWSEKTLFVQGLDSLPDFEPGDSVDLPLQIKDKNGNPVSVRGIITIYDSSLDEISPHSWSGIPWPVIKQIEPYRSGAFGLRWLAIEQYPKTVYNDITALPDLALNWFGLNYYGIRAFPGREMAAQPAARQIKAGEMEQLTNDSQQESLIDPEASDVEGADRYDPPYFRKDFRETAYFTSEFETNREGKGNIVFKVPDAVTRWNVKLFGHDGFMAQVLDESDFQSQKQLMLLPNLPRFVRAGDQMKLSVKLSWSGTTQAAGIAGISLENAAIQGKTLNEQFMSLDLSPGEQKALEWEIKVPDDLNLMRIKLSSSAGGYEDGFSAEIPVLPKELSFWDSHNFFLKDPGDINVSGRPGASRAILEINTRPVWLAVQSLPVLSGKDLPCSELWYTRYYTSRLIEKISRDIPEIRNELSKLASEIDADPRLNPWLRNEEIRRFALDEGLWEGSDENEAVHIKMLSEAFDPDINSSEINRSLNELSGLQLADGSWPWFRGMRPDFRMTLYILGGLGQLVEMDGPRPEGLSALNHIIEKALGYVDRKVSDDFTQFKVHNPDDDPPLTSDLVHYLYVRSFFPHINISGEYKEAYDFYFSQACNKWLEFSVPQQAFIAIACQRGGESGPAVKIFNSLLDRRLESDAGGIFWKSSQHFGSWFERDIWQQSLVIELFSIMPEGDKYIDNLKTWLIQQKRGRDWGGRMATTHAVKSLLVYGSDWYGVPASLVVGSGRENFSRLRIDLGTDASGYYRYAWEESDLPASGLELNIKKNDSSPAWGSLITESLIGIDSLMPSGEELKVRRIVFIQDNNGGNDRWLPAEGQEIRTGQRIKVRLEVEASQALDYVQLRDYRPAAFEPDKSLSGYKWGNGVFWYQVQADQYTDFYISHLPKGYSFFEYDLYAEQAGDFSMGYSEVQSQYAPEFLARSSGGRIILRDN